MKSNSVRRGHASLKIRYPPTKLNKTLCSFNQFRSQKTTILSHKVPFRVKPALERRRPKVSIILKKLLARNSRTITLVFRTNHSWAPNLTITSLRSNRSQICATRFQLSILYRLYPLSKALKNNHNQEMSHPGKRNRKEIKRAKLEGIQMVICIAKMCLIISTPRTNKSSKNSSTMSCGHRTLLCEM